MGSSVLSPTVLKAWLSWLRSGLLLTIGLPAAILAIHLEVYGSSPAVNSRILHRLSRRLRLSSLTTCKHNRRPSGKRHESEQQVASILFVGRADALDRAQSLSKPKSLLRKRSMTPGALDDKDHTGGSPNLPSPVPQPPKPAPHSHSQSQSQRPLPQPLPPPTPLSLPDFDPRPESDLEPEPELLPQPSSPPARTSRSLPKALHKSLPAPQSNPPTASPPQYQPAAPTAALPPSYASHACTQAVDTTLSRPSPSPPQPQDHTSGQAGDTTLSRTSPQLQNPFPYQNITYPNITFPNITYPSITYPNITYPNFTPNFTINITVPNASSGPGETHITNTTLPQHSSTSNLEVALPINTSGTTLGQNPPNLNHASSVPVASSTPPQSAPKLAVASPTVVAEITPPQLPPKLEVATPTVVAETKPSRPSPKRRDASSVHTIDRTPQLAPTLKLASPNHTIDATSPQLSPSPTFEDVSARTPEISFPQFFSKLKEASSHIVNTTLPQLSPKAKDASFTQTIDSPLLHSSTKSRDIVTAQSADTRFAKPSSTTPKVKDYIPPSPRVRKFSLPSPPQTPSPLRYHEVSPPSPKAQEFFPPAPIVEEFSPPSPKLQEASPRPPKPQVPASISAKLREPSPPPTPLQEPSPPSPEVKELPPPSPAIEKPSPPSPKVAAAESSPPSPTLQEPSQKLQEPAPSSKPQATVLPTKPKESCLKLKDTASPEVVSTPTPSKSRRVSWNINTPLPEPSPKPRQMPTHTRSMSHADVTRQSKRLSLQFPIQPAAGSSSPGFSPRSRPQSWVAAPSAATTPDATTSPVEGNLLAVLAAQERYVLELKEELTKAEEDLKILKKHWATHESVKQRNEIRKVTQLQPLDTSLANYRADEEDEDGSTVWMQKEMERRKALISGARTPQRKVFSGSRHLRTLSLLSPDKTYTPSFPQPPDVRNSIDSTINEPLSGDGSKRPQVLTRSSSTSPDIANHIANNMLDERYDLGGLSNIQRDALLRTGRKMAYDFKDGLLTFIEDIRQATVGEEAVNGMDNPSTVPARGPTGKPMRKASDARPPLNRATSSKKASASHRSDDIGDDFWKEHGLSEPKTASPSQKTHALKNHQTPQKNAQKDEEFEEWDSWDTPNDKAAAMTGSGVEANSSDESDEPSSPVSGPASSRTSTRYHSRRHDSKASSLTNFSSTGSAEDFAQRDSKRNSIPWPDLVKMSPSNLKRTASHLMKEWEKNLTPPPESRDSSHSSGDYIGRSSSPAGLP